MKFDQNTIDLFIHTIKQYGWMDLPSYGSSMYPFIKKGNICSFVMFDRAKIKKGDVLLYHTPSGELIAHRLLRVIKGKKQREYVLKGDMNTITDGVVREEQIIGVLTMINNQKRTIYTDDYSAIFWSFLISTFPRLSGLVRSYLSFKRNIITKLKIHNA